MIKVNNLKKEYKDFTLNCSFEVKSGCITALIGQNGAGKSTAFKAILGLIGTQGEITVLGKSIKSFTSRDKEALGVVLSDSGFSGYLTVGQIIPILRAMYKSFDEPLFRSCLQRFGLPTDKAIKDFSTGMKAKLKLTVAISHGAKLLILDEPTAGLDVIARDELLTLLREFMEQDSQRAILISSHISSDLETLCDDIYMIDNGSIIFHEDTHVLLGSYALLKLSKEEYSDIDKEHLLYVRKEPFGYSCLTAQRDFYRENYPSLAIERGDIDKVITMMIRGEKI